MCERSQRGWMSLLEKESYFCKILSNKLLTSEDSTVFLWSSDKADMQITMKTSSTIRSFHFKCLCSGLNIFKISDFCIFYVSRLESRWGMRDMSERGTWGVFSRLRLPHQHSLPFPISTSSASSPATPLCTVAIFIFPCITACVDSVLMQLPASAIISGLCVTSGDCLVGCQGKAIVKQRAFMTSYLLLSSVLSASAFIVRWNAATCPAATATLHTLNLQEAGSRSHRKSYFAGWFTGFSRIGTQDLIKVHSAKKKSLKREKSVENKDKPPNINTNSEKP